MKMVRLAKLGLCPRTFRVAKWRFSRCGRDCHAAKDSRAKTGEGSDFQAASSTRLHILSGLFFAGQSTEVAIMIAMLPAMCRCMETLPWEALYTHGRWRYILETENFNNLVNC